MAVPVAIIAKAAASAATDKRTWKIVGVIIAVIMLPVILGFGSVLSIIGGVGTTNRDLVRYSFTNDWLPITMKAEQKQAINDMRGYLKDLKKEIKDGDYKDLDKRLVRASFYCLFFGTELDEDFDYGAFIKCFEEYEVDEVKCALNEVADKLEDLKITPNHVTAIQNLYKYLEDKKL